MNGTGAEAIGNRGWRTWGARGLALAVLGTFAWGGHAAPVAPAPVAVPLGNGDVNGDGAYNLSDAVYFLNWLFQAGPEPIAIDVAPAPNRSELPATGRTLCTNPDGSLVPCVEAVCAGQDGAYQSGCSGEGRFEDHGDGTVTDHCTGLMWQRETADMNADGRVDDTDWLDWCGSLAYCEALSFAGYEDWRLPNVRELSSLVDYGRSFPAIDPLFGVGPFGCYYTSSPLIGGPGPGQFTVDFGLGLVGGGGPGLPCHVRAVRKAPSR